MISEKPNLKIKEVTQKPEQLESILPEINELRKKLELLMNSEHSPSINPIKPEKLEIRQKPSKYQSELERIFNTETTTN